MNTGCFCNFADHANHLCGSKDGSGSADHDKPFVFGRRITPESPFPFTTVQLARLMIVRSQVQAGAR